VLLVFAPLDERALARIPGLSVGIVSAAQGHYSRTQLLLDVGQGVRVADSAYPSSSAPALSVLPSGLVRGWRAAVGRARDAPQELTPGLLAQTVPGGAAYAGVAGSDDLDAVAGADSAGWVASMSLGDAGSLPRRIASLLGGHRLVVADLPSGAAGAGQLAQLVASRPPGELLLVVQRAADGPGGQLLWGAAAGLPGGGARELTSDTTQQRGLVASFDLAPTALRWLGRPIPSQMRGAPLRTDGGLDSSGLRTLMARLRAVGPRRLRALGVLLCAWALLLLACAGRAAWRGRALRAGALGLLWSPVIVLAPAALAPGAGLEYALIALGCLGSGALTDLLVPWPRALAVPAVAAPLAILLDALTRSELLVRSLLGPDPILGARFYGIGNELKSGLAVAALAGLAAVLAPGRGSRTGRAVPALITCGLALAAIEGSARVGAGVGGVILVCAGFAAAAVLLLPGASARRRALTILIAPVAGLAGLAVLDLLTAHGSGHFTGSVLHARSAGDLRDVIVRRYKAAWQELGNEAMPAATALALAAAGLALARRDRLLAPVGGDPVWRAALSGGLAAGIVGSLVEDSGPVLLVVAVFALGCVLAYLWARPAQAPEQG
jgi:hypothetical protein